MLHVPGAVAGYSRGPEGGDGEDIKGSEGNAGKP